MKLSSNPHVGRYFLFLLLFFGLALLAFWAVGVEEAEGATLYVDDDAEEGGNGSMEKPFAKIQDAVEAAEEGDTVRVWEGIYLENINVDRSLNLIGNGSTESIISGRNGGIFGRDVVAIKADWVNVSGFRVSNAKGGSKSGILVAGDNNQVFDNECSSNNLGVRVYKANNNSVFSNRCFSNGIGIDLYFDAHYNKIMNNSITDTAEGLVVSYSSHNLVENNICQSSKEIDISITGDSRENVLKNNSMMSWGLLAVSNNSIDTSNTVQGKPVLVLEKQKDILIPGDVGQLILDNCSGVAITRLNFQDIKVPVSLSFCSAVSVRDSTFSGGDYGIIAFGCENSSFEDNSLSNISSCGIKLVTSSWNSVSFNVFRDCEYGTELVEGSNNNTMANNEFPGGGWLAVGNSHTNTIRANTFIGDGGISLGWSHFNIIEYNTCDKLGKTPFVWGRRMLYLGGSNHNLIQGNNFSNDSEFSAIVLQGSDNNSLLDNVCCQNWDGVELEESHFNTIVGMNCAFNDQRGIMLKASRFNKLLNSICFNNSQGLWLEAADFNTISNNSFLQNDYGSTLHYARNNSFTNNTFSNGKEGISLYSYSSDNIFENNSVKGNERGFYLADYMENTRINGNSISGNSNGGVVFRLPSRFNPKLDVSENWWGDDSGPYHPELNPKGKGDNVTEGVSFSSWLDSKGKIHQSPFPEEEEDNAFFRDFLDRLFGHSRVLGGVVALAVAFYVVEPLRYALLSLYTRLNPEKIESDIAQQNIRGRVYQFVKGAPGVNLSTIKEEMKLGYGTVVYHLEVLQRERYLRSAVSGRRKQFWTKRDFPGADKPLLSETQQKILDTLLEAGPLSRTELCEKTGIARSTLGLNLAKLVEQGKVEEETRGKEKVCSLKLY